MTFRRDRRIKRNGWLAVSPLLVFVTLFLLLSITLSDFYKIPIMVVFIVAAIYGIGVTRGLPLSKRISLFSRGAGAENLMLMIWIFVFAGAFAEMAKDMGAIDAAVGLTLNLLPGNMLLAGFFLASCLISLSIGTSVGTIVALVPMVAGVSERTGIDLAMLTAVVVGGSFFGDNLSFISDTTVVAARTQGCKLSDKFAVNFRIVLPAAFLTFALYVFLGFGFTLNEASHQIDWLKIAPYLVVLVAAVSGLNVLIALTLGILLTSIIGLLTADFTLAALLASAGKGILGMSELIIVSMLAGGLLELIRYNGGITFIIKALTRRVRSKRGAELGIAGLVCLTNLCTANNTIAILSVGSIARDIAAKYGVDPRKSASILDTFSCLIQGIIPYGAQLLMASALVGLSPIAIMPYLYYPLLMGLSALVAIWLRYPRRYS